MNDPLTPATSLFALTAPKPSEPRRGGADDARFSDQLAQTTTDNEATPSTRSAETRVEEAGDSEGSSVAETHEPTTDQAPQDAEIEPTAESDPTTDEQLLVVAVAHETIVLETPPDAQLPEEASTQIDVTAENEPVENLVPAGFRQLETPIEVGVETAAVSEPSGELLTDAEPEQQQPAGGAVGAVASNVAASEPGDAQVVTSTASNATAAAPTENEATTDDSAPRTSALTESETTLERQGAEHPSDGESQQESGEAEADVELPLKPLPTAAAASIASVEVGDALPTEPSTTSSTTPSTATSNGVADPTAGKVGTTSAAIEASQADPAPTVDPSRFVSRVARAFDMAQERGGGPISLRLSPPELGSLQVKIEIREGVMTAALEAETPAARNALLDNLPALRERLEQQQIRIEKFDVDVRDESSSQNEDWRPDGEAEQRSDDRPPREEDRPDRPALEPVGSTTSEARSVSTIAFDNNGINVVA